MSFQAMTWATAQKLPCNQKMVLLMLANRTNQDTGRCDPSHKLLAEDCGLSLASVKRAISELEKGGLLEVIHRTHEGVNLPNQYRLNLRGVGSQRAEGWGQSEPRVGSQRATNQEVNQEVKPVGDSDESAPPKTDKPKTKKATPIPDDFEPSDTNRRVAGEQGVSIRDELPKFMDHFRANGKLMKDWHACLNNWLRNSTRFNGGAARAPAAMTSQTGDQINPHGRF